MYCFSFFLREHVKRSLLTQALFLLGNDSFSNFISYPNPPKKKKNETF